jgi:hypothetical protein
MRTDSSRGLEKKRFNICKVPPVEIEAREKADHTPIVAHLPTQSGRQIDLATADTRRFIVTWHDKKRFMLLLAV